MLTWRTIAAAVCALCASAGARAEYISNGGFETGDLSGWTRSGETDFLGVLPLVQRSGSYGAFAGPVGGFGSLSQSFSAPAGQALTVSFFLNSSDDTANRLQVIWNGAVIDDRADIPADFYTGYSYSVSAAAANALTLSFLNPSTFFYLDDVSVVEATAAAVPEPAALALLGTATAGLFALRQRRRPAGSYVR